MAKRKAEEELPDLCGRQAGRFPWDNFSPEQQQQLDEAHKRAACLVAGGHGAVSWEELTGRR